ncbi:MAG: trypsin-like peptidase domain-containing protein, partial [Bacteriovorax sp.]|nr:trypsin-like peptidase domain-containing protein [Bacteriovorax sp.]
LVSELDGQFNEIQIEQSRAVLAQVPKWRITSEDKTSISIKTKSLASGMNFCSDEKFSDLPLVSSCSAFLVGPDLLLTAGHCVKDKSDCQNSYWILDYNDIAGFDNSTGTTVFQKDNIVTCAQILSRSENPKLDYALIKLNRKITDRTPLKIRRLGTVDSADSLLVIGHPMGLPKIMADQALIRDNSLTYTFVTNADTFSGNSGSPVINPATQMVEGILVRGDEDFKMDLDLGCNRSFHCYGPECKGETVQRTTVLPLKLIPKI